MLRLCSLKYWNRLLSPIFSHRFVGIAGKGKFHLITGGWCIFQKLHCLSSSSSSSSASYFSLCKIGQKQLGIPSRDLGLFLSQLWTGSSSLSSWSFARFTSWLHILLFFATNGYADRSSKEQHEASFYSRNRTLSRFFSDLWSHFEENCELRSKFD